MGEIHLGGDAAVVGGVHNDSHDIHNITNSSTIYEAQRSEFEINQHNETQFLNEVQMRLADGRLDHQEMAELEQLSMRWHIPWQQAEKIIEQVRRSSKVLTKSSSDDHFAQQLLGEVFDAVQDNEIDVLERKLRPLREEASNSSNADIQFYYNLVLASLHPESATVSLLGSRIDEYWQLYWAHIAYLKLGDTNNAAMLLPQLGNFNEQKGNIALLMAIDNIAELRSSNNMYYRKQAEQQLEQALQYGMAEQLGGLWYGAKAILQEEQGYESWYCFYVERTLKEFAAMPRLEFEKSAIPQMPDMAKAMAEAQNVKLSQMQGWNALDAVNQMGFGNPTMPGQVMGGMPQIPGVTKTTQMPQMPGIPQMPQASPMPQMPQMPGMPPMPQMPGMPGMPQMPPMPGMPLPGSQIPTAQPTSAIEQEAAHLATEVRQPEEKEDEPDPYEPLYGIILTNGEILANKYGCSIEELYEVINDFMQRAYDQEMYWQFMDVSTIGGIRANSWQDINSAISDFIEQNELEASPSLHLFIIGGADVIPIPMVADPYENGGGSIPSDMCYSFHDTYLQNMVDGEQSVLDISYARNNVSRLPLEDGPMETTLEEDLCAYFNISSMYGGGIPVGNVVMSSNSEWIPASATMSEHLPLLYSAKDPELVKNGMYISPKLYTSDEQSMEIYCSSLAKADMLMFNLHGADHPDYPGFYSYDEAFHPSLLQQSNARVFNTVACFGARYKGYSRDESMLLSALYGGGVLLYTGSLVPVPMYYDYENNEARELLLNPGTGSEVFMRLFPLYQFKGMTAGYALLKAKCDYFNMCRHIESDGFSLSTALMFSLYGNPMLHVRKQDHVIAAALQNDVIPPAPVKAEPLVITKTKKQTVFQKRESESLLDQIRGYVDANLEAIRKMVETHLYNQLGLPPRQLESIDQFSRPTIDGNYELGYMFNYSDSDAVFASKTYVEVSMEGKLKRVYRTK